MSKIYLKLGHLKRCQLESLWHHPWIEPANKDASSQKREFHESFLPFQFESTLMGDLAWMYGYSKLMVNEIVVFFHKCSIKQLAGEFSPNKYMAHQPTPMLSQSQIASTPLYQDQEKRQVCDNGSIPLENQPRMMSIGAAFNIQVPFGSKRHNFLGVSRESTSRIGAPPHKLDSVHPPNYFR